MKKNNKRKASLFQKLLIFVLLLSISSAVLLILLYDYSIFRIGEEILLLFMIGGIETLILSMFISKIIENNAQKEQKNRINIMFLDDVLNFRKIIRQNTVCTVFNGYSDNTYEENYAKIIANPEQYIDKDLAQSRVKLHLSINPYKSFEFIDIDVSFYGYAIHNYDQVYNLINRFYEQNKHTLPLFLCDKFIILLSTIEDYTMQGPNISKERRLSFAQAKDQTPENTAKGYIEYISKIDKYINEIVDYFTE